MTCRWTQELAALGTAPSPSPSGDGGQRARPLANRRSCPVSDSWTLPSSGPHPLADQACLCLLGGRRSTSNMQYSPVSASWTMPSSAPLSPRRPSPVAAVTWSVTPRPPRSVPRNPHLPFVEQWSLWASRCLSALQETRTSCQQQLRSPDQHCHLNISCGPPRMDSSQWK